MFAGAGVYKMPVFSLLRFLNPIGQGTGIKPLWGVHFPKRHVEDLQIPAHKLFVRYAAFVATLFIVSSLSPASTFTSAYIDSASYSDTDGFWENIGEGNTILTDQDGYLTKLNPQTNAGDRSALHDALMHTTVAGENISTIAAKYGLRANTILWANNLSNANTIKINQQLLIPPVDGVYHRVNKGEGIEKIASSYSVIGETILKQNNLSIGAILSPDDKLFVPGGKPLVTTSPRRIHAAGRDTPARIASTGRVNSAIGGAILNNTDEAPLNGKPFIFPTHGKTTQGFRRGHYAIDIANTDRPAIWAAGGGEITKVINDCADVSYRCGNGYGNHVVIDHGDGLQTLYAHLTYTSVQVGDKVEQGQVIGKMGRSGRVHGATGIHLHFETHKNGVKILPSKYY